MGERERCSEKSGEWKKRTRGETRRLGTNKKPRGVPPRAVSTEPRLARDEPTRGGPAPKKRLKRGVEVNYGG